MGAPASWSCSRRSGSSLTSLAAMESKSQLRCVIAAGGTAGHVMPSLAVARALSARGVQVSFAGSPDRIEARLVPEAGYEFDAFRISGLPRRPGVAQLRAALLAGRAPSACARILAARQPDVVLGGGGYVAGPMVYAAWRKRIPGGADRGRRASRAREPARRAVRAAGLPRRTRCRSGPKFRVVGRPVLRAEPVPVGGGAARASGCRPRARCCSSSAAARARRR